MGSGDKVKAVEFLETPEPVAIVRSRLSSEVLAECSPFREEIVELRLVSRDGVGDLTQLAKFPKLRRLYVVDRCQDDLSFLKNLSELEVLAVSENRRLELDFQYWPRLRQLGVDVSKKRLKHAEQALYFETLVVSGSPGLDLAEFALFPSLEAGSVRWTVFHWTSGGLIPSFELGWG
ncbi:MAG TPA: hypothetical protein VIJ12_06425 [Candidatus Baltobacteraceae bacterium]